MSLHLDLDDNIYRINYNLDRAFYGTGCSVIKYMSLSPHIIKVRVYAHMIWQAVALEEYR